MCSVEKDSPLHGFVVSYIHRVWGSRDYFPGPQPISIERRHFPILKSGNYVVCEKTDGERHMLVAVMFEGSKKCLLVNRSFKMFDIAINLKKSAFDGTILDGELYENTFMIYDAVRVAGQTVWNVDLHKRMDAAKALLKGLISMKSDPYRLKCKRFFPMSDFKSFMYDYLPTVTQKTDGLVFTPVDQPIRLGTHETMFKWKSVRQNTVDFQLKWEPSRENPGFKRGRSTWRLYVQEKGKLYYESEIPEGKFDRSWMEEDAIVECEYVTWEQPNWWRPIKRRVDKTYPNSRRTFYRTIVNIKEAIEMSEFLG
jgi:hypothetical protein